MYLSIEYAVKWPNKATDTFRESVGLKKEYPPINMYMMSF